MRRVQILRVAGFGVGVALAAVLGSAGPTFGQIDQILAPDYANDGTLYVIYRQNPSPVANSDGVQVTHIVGTLGAISASIDPGAGSGTTSTAQVFTTNSLKLLALGQVQETGILANAATFVKFDPAANGGKGILCLTTNNADVASTCTNGTKITRDGGAGFASVCALADGCGGVPAAGIGHLSLGPFNGTAYTFGSPPPDPPTTQRTVCGAPPSDGFVIPSGDSLVVIYDLGNKFSFAGAVAGFTVDTQAPFNSSCTQTDTNPRVLSATIDQDTIQGPAIFVTPTPAHAPAPTLSESNSMITVAVLFLGGLWCLSRVARRSFE